jgi:protein-tyrosine-phosphatase
VVSGSYQTAFDAPILRSCFARFSSAASVRTGFGQLLGEFIATFGLLAVIWGCARLRSSAVPFAVGAYIAGAYWFTSSTSFANPAVTLARTASDTFAGIRPVDFPAFLVAQLLGAAAGTLLLWWLIPSLPTVATKVLARNEASDQFGVSSAGTKPSEVRPEAIEVMREVGIDISGQRSKSVDEFAGQSFDYVITVCDNAKQSCPFFPGKAERLHWSFSDPAEAEGTREERLAEFRRVRDQIGKQFHEFVAGRPGTS